MRRWIALTAVVPLLVAVPALSENSRERNPDQIVCKSSAKTSTRFSTRICHSRADWEKIIEQQKRDAEDLLNTRVVETRRGG